MGSVKLKVKLLILLPIIAAVGGCAVKKYDGPGNQSQFEAARFSCLQQTPMSTVSGGALGQYGATYSSSTLPSCSVFASCLAAKGYVVSKDGRLTPSVPVKCN